MSYNNIGLTTPRGSGTSGHVQRNLSNIQSRDSHSLQSRPRYDKDQLIKHRKPDEAILEHDRKRRIENKCVELQLTLEEDGLDESLIEIQVNELRTTLLSEQLGKEKLTLKPHQTHELAALKAKENDKFRVAMGVQSSYVEGEAFNKEIQLQKKQQAIEEREKRDQERLMRILAQKESKEERERHQEAIQKEMKARREEAERRRSLLDNEKNSRRVSDHLADRIQPNLSAGGHHRGRRDSDDDRRRHRSRTPSGSPPPPPSRTNRYRGNDSRYEPDVYRPSRRRSVSRSRSRSPPRRRRPSRSLSRSPPRRREDSRSPPPRRNVRDRSVSRSRSRSIDSNRRSPQKKSRHLSNTPPPPGFRAIHQSDRTSSRVRSQSPLNDSRRFSRGRSHSSVERSRRSSRVRSRSPSEEPRARSRVRSRSPPPSRSRRSRSIGSDREGSMDMSDASD
ncbi:hypothetical protein DFH28DRAFT_1016106 [Melampsora americana]|nr:hypothetical protein DFH28DRAFT_1016106 [Melampsora americana]